MIDGRVVVSHITARYSQRKNKESYKNRYTDGDSSDKFAVVYTKLALSLWCVYVFDGERRGINRVLDGDGDGREVQADCWRRSLIGSTNKL